MSVLMTEHEAVFSDEVEQQIADLMSKCKGPYRMQDGSGCGMTNDPEVAEHLLRTGFPTIAGGKMRCGSRGTWLAEDESLWHDLGYPIAMMQAWESRISPF